MVSISTPGARSKSLNPDEVISITAILVTIFFTHLTPVKGRLQSSRKKWVNNILNDQNYILLL